MKPPDKLAPTTTVRCSSSRGGSLAFSTGAAEVLAPNTGLAVAAAELALEPAADARATGAPEAAPPPPAGPPWDAEQEAKPASRAAQPNRPRQLRRLSLLNRKAAGPGWLATNGEDRRLVGARLLSKCRQHEFRWSGARIHPRECVAIRRANEVGYR